MVKHWSLTLGLGMVHAFDDFFEKWCERLLFRSDVRILFHPLCLHLFGTLILVLLISFISFSYEVFSLLVLIPFFLHTYCSNSCRYWYILHIHLLLFCRLVENVGYSPSLFSLITFLRKGIHVFSFGRLYPPSLTNPEPWEYGSFDSPLLDI